MSTAPRWEPGEVGTVVYYAEKQRLIPALVVAREGSRYVLENPLGERFAVVQSRLYWLSTAPPGPAPTAPGTLSEHLNTRFAAVESLAQTLDLERAWATLEKARPHPVGAPLAVDVREVATALARPGVDLALLPDAVIAAVFANPSTFRVKDRVLFRESAAAVAEARKKREAEAERVRVLALATSAFAKLRQTQDRATLSADEASAFATYREAVISVAAHGRESDRFAFVQPLCEALGVHPDLSFDLLVEVGELAPDDNLAAQRAGLPLTFSAEVLAEAHERATHRPQPSLDLTHLHAIAIDDPETTEVDDAVALDGDRLYVLIADAASYVLPGSALDKAAMERTSTIYLPEGKVPMVPEVLGEGPMSLNPGEAKTALVFSFELAADGGLTAFDVHRARVRIAQRFTYTEVDEVLRGTASAPNDSNTLLRRLEALMNRHRDYRHKKGAVTFQRPEVYYGVDPLGPDDRPGQRKVRIKIGDPLGPARQLIAELMVATCTGAAVYCAERQIPCVYRTQAPPDDPTQKGHAAGRAINPTSGLVDDAALQYELLRRMKPSVLTTTPGPHWTLAVPAYTQITSPIRRYADLLMHQQLSSFLKTGRPAFSASRLDGQLAELARRQIIARRVEQESRRYWALRYVEQNPGLTLTGTTLREIGKKTLVELAPIAIHELITLRRRHPVGHRLRFEVIECSARRDTIVLKELV